MRWWGAQGRPRQAYSWAKRREDRELVERAKRDPEAFRALYDRYFEPTYRLVYSRVQNEALARDLTARGFVRAERLIRGYRHSCSFRSLLPTLAPINPAPGRPSLY